MSTGLGVYYGMKHNDLLLTFAKRFEVGAADEDLKTVIVGIPSAVEDVYVFFQSLKVS